MSFFDAMILGIVQGLTEFLPVSSSGHLVILENLLNIRSDSDVLFHVGLLLSDQLSVLFLIENLDHRGQQHIQKRHDQKKSEVPEGQLCQAEQRCRPGKGNAGKQGDSRQGGTHYRQRRSALQEGNLARAQEM